jgi:hypothetical protein
LARHISWISIRCRWAMAGLGWACEFASPNIERKCYTKRRQSPGERELSQLVDLDPSYPDFEDKSYAKR